MEGVMSSCGMESEALCQDLVDEGVAKDSEVNNGQE